MTLETKTATDTAPVTETAPGTARPRRASDGMRKDIQGLRALAVGLVIAYHFWPGTLTGGYVGVDVFFVISGFLITLHLLRHPVHGGRDLLAFWGRRIRRLLPAATLVLVATGVAGFLWLPSTVHAQLSGHIAASSLYVENWVLAYTSTDYLAQGELHSALQHFWSLSVEEQFYIFWPVLVSIVLLVAAWSVRAASARVAADAPAGLSAGLPVQAPARAARRPGGPVTILGLGLVGAASLIWSVVDTRTDPAQAYFVTSTRIWELALGGTIAAAVSSAIVPRHHTVKAVLAWTGLALVVYAALTFDEGTPFPGSSALIPTLGAAAVILADADRAAFSPARLWRPRAVQAVGDWSYSLYLWHWPVLVIAPFALHSKLGILDKTCLLGIVVVLSAVTKRLVEDGVRFHPALTGSLRRTYLLLLACLTLSLSAAGALALAAPQADDSRIPKLMAERCFGAAAFREAGCAEGTEHAVVSGAFAKKDRAEAYDDRCLNRKPYTSHTVCTYGRQDSPLRVALLGNSHAVHWQPPLAKAAQENGWRLDTYLETVCYPVDVPLRLPSEQEVRNCADWNAWAVNSIVKGDYDVVVISNRSFTELKGVSKADKQRVAAASYGRVLDRITASGARVLVIRDTPRSFVEIPDCVAQYGDDLARCSAPASKAIEPDPLAEAGRQRGGADGPVAVLDVNDRFCRHDVCYGVVGGAVTSFDHGHITKTFAMTLYPEVITALKDLQPRLITAPDGGS